jgi:hypothetical protein
MKFCLIIHLVSAIAMSTDFAEPVMKFLAVLWCANGLWCMIDPAGALAAWGAKKQPESVRERLNVDCREFGTFLVSFCTFSGSQLFLGVNPTKAMGYAIIPWLFTSVRDYLDGTYKKYNIGLEKMFPWVIYHAVVIATLVF